MRNRLKDVVSAVSGADAIQAILISFLVKGFFTSFGYPEVAVCGLLITGLSFKAYLNSKQPKIAELDAETRAEIDTLKAAVSALKMERNLNSSTQVRQKFF